MCMAPDAESLNRQSDTMKDPIIWMGSWSSASSGGIPVTILGGLSPCRDQVISTNPGGGVKGWLLDSVDQSSASWDEVAHELVWAGVVTSGAGHLPPQAADRDPLK